MHSKSQCFVGQPASSSVPRKFFSGPRNGNSGQPYVLLQMLLFIFFIYFFYHRISELPRPIAVKVCDRHLDALYNPSPKIQKIWGPYPKKNLGPKTCKVWGDFTQLPTLVANISGTSQHIQNQKDMRYVTENDSFSIRRNKYGELWSTVYKVGHVSLDPPKSTFLGDCFGSYGVLAPQIFYMC